MGYKTSQLSSQSANVISIEDSGSSLLSRSGATQSFPFWLTHRPEGDGLRHVNWDLVLGMALVVVISAGFWAFLGLTISQLWK